MEAQFKITIDAHKKETLRAINDMKREGKKDLTAVDSKLLKMIADIRIAQTNSDEDKESLSKDFSKLEKLVNDMNDLKEDKTSVVEHIANEAKKNM